MKKKILAMLTTLSMACSMFASMAMPVCAANTEYENETSGSVAVSVSVESSYIVSLPATLALTRDGATDNYKGDFNVGVKANLTDSEKVTVTPSSTFVMTNASVTSVTATANVTQNCTTWQNQVDPFTYTEGSSTSQKADKDSFKEVKCDVSVELPVAGSYSGTLNFTFSKGTI